MSRLMLLLLSGILLAYPLGVYFGLHYFEPRVIGLLLLVLLLMRFLLARQQISWEHFKSIVPVTIIATILSVCIIVFNQHYLIKLNPVLINFATLLTFVYTLYKPPSMIERFARLTEPDLPEKARKYCYKVTQAWCLLFLLNGSIALYTCFYTSMEMWVLYNGLIAYLLIGIFCLVEYGIRQKVRRRV